MAAHSSTSAESKANIDAQIEEMRVERAAQAEKKLAFLLRQSDIFTHFGLDTSKLDDAPSRRKKDFGRRRMTEKEGDREDLKVGDGIQGTRLIKQPSIVKGEMRPYQLEGLNWLIRNHENGVNGILADEMGLGKTLQSISILAYMYEFEDNHGPHLVLVPKSTMANWMNEIQRWCPSLTGVRFHGSKDERQAMIQNVLKPGQRDDQREWNIVVTTYETANSEKSCLQKFAWKYLIIDEAHRIKNENAQFSKTVRMLHSKERLLITGTPLQNNLHELWALLNFLLPDIFSDSDQFDQWFNLEVDDREAKERMIRQLHKLLRPFMLRRLKVDVEKSLPGKTETVLYVGMSTMQKGLYKDLLSRNKDIVIGKYQGNGAPNTGGNRTAILNIVMQLRKCCNHPYLFANVEDRSLDPHGSHLVENCGKLVLLDKLLTRLKEKDHRVLIFSQMTRMIDILDDYLFSKGYEYCRIDGKTSYEDRSDLIDAFNAPESSKFAFLLSTRAGGLGINLQTADTVILFDSDWNPQADLQAQDRAHRIGQKKPVHVYRLVTENSIEEKVVERAHQKLKLDAMVVQHGRLQEKDRMTKDDMLSAIKYGADNIFRTSNESSITDEDIDVLIERGQKKTKEMMQLLEKADKGDLFDFSLKFDGSTGVQEYEGVDYSDPKARQQAIDDQLLSLMSEEARMAHTEKRQRKPVANYNEDAYYRQAVKSELANERKAKMPKHMRLPKMEEWHFYDEVRLRELYALEEQAYQNLRATKSLPAHGLRKMQLLSDEDQAEKNRLLAEGFAGWSKQHYNNFIKGSAKYGRFDYANIAMEVGKSASSVKKYSEVFWSQAPERLGVSEMDSIIRRVEKGEKKLAEIERLKQQTKRFLARWPDPLTQLEFRYVGSHGHVHGADEDRHLLVYTDRYGHGNWARIRAEVRSCELFHFDYYLRSLSAAELGKRCEKLMVEASKELSELEKRANHQSDIKRKLAATAAENENVQAAARAVPREPIASVSGSSPPSSSSPTSTVASSSSANMATESENASMSSTSEVVPMEIESKSSEVAATDVTSAAVGTMSAPKSLSTQELLERRAKLYLEQMERLKMIDAKSSAEQIRAVLMPVEPAASEHGDLPSPSEQQASNMDIDDFKPRSDGDGRGRGPRDNGKYVKRPVTDNQVPFLLAIVFEMRLDPRGAVVKQFVKRYPEVSKRQVEEKLSEVAVKEKRYNIRAWWLKDPYEKQYREYKSEHGNPLIDEENKGDEGAAATSPQGDDVISNSINVNEASEEALLSSETAVDNFSVLVKPHAPYSDKALFRKHHLQTVKNELQPGASKNDLKIELDKRWALASQKEKALWGEKASEDQRRFELEQAAYEAQQQSQDLQSGGMGKDRETKNPKKRAKKSDGGISVIPKKKARA